MARLSLAFRAFFAIVRGGGLPEDVAAALGLGKAKRESAPAGPARQPADGALQMLGILQRDARLVDFLMEDIASYSDQQVGAAVRDLHEQGRKSLARYLELAPVLDGIEGSFTRVDPQGPDQAAVKFLGNVPAQGRPNGGVLRHRGWRARKTSLPALDPRQDPSLIAPAELEIE